MKKRTIAVVVIAAVVLGAGAYAWAESQPARPRVTATQVAATPTTAAGQAGPAARIRALAKRAVHGDLIVRGKSGFVTVSYDRGKVSAVSGTEITLARPDGVSVTKTITSTTKFRGVTSSGEVQVGKGAIVISKGDQAVLIAQPRPPTS